MSTRKCADKLIAFSPRKLPQLVETANERADLRIASELEKFRDQLAVDIGAGRPIFLKHALSALFLPVICSVFDTRLIYVVRPLVDIETTRLRSAWPAQFGAKGAEIIYSHMFRTFVDHAFPTTVIRYAELLEAPLQQARHLSEFAGLESSQRAIEHAAAFVTNPRSDRGKLG